MGTGNVTFFLSPVAGFVNTLCKIILISPDILFVEKGSINFIMLL